MIKENDSFPIRQLGIGIPQANICAQTYSQLKAGVGHTVEMFFLKVNLLGGTLPVGLFYSCTSCDYTKNSMPWRLFTWTISQGYVRREQSGGMRWCLHETEQVCYNRGRFLNSRFFNCDTKLYNLSSSMLPLWDLGGKARWHKREAHDAGSAVSNKVLFLWPKSLVFSVSIFRAVTGYLLSL